jgi:hypothetical protein
MNINTYKDQAIAKWSLLSTQTKVIVAAVTLAVILATLYFGIGGLVDKHYANKYQKQIEATQAKADAAEKIATEQKAIADSKAQEAQVLKEELKDETLQREQAEQLLEQLHGNTAQAQKALATIRSRPVVHHDPFHEPTDAELRAAAAAAGVDIK